MSKTLYVDTGHLASVVDAAVAEPGPEPGLEVSERRRADRIGVHEPAAVRGGPESCRNG